MADNMPNDTKEISGAIKRVNWLGTTTERLFSRVYENFRRRSKLQQQYEALDEQRQQLQAELAKNRTQDRQLRRVLEDREQEIDRLNGILATITEGVIMQDTEGRIVMINEAAQQLIGGTRHFWQSALGTFFNQYRQVETVSNELAPLGEPRRIEVNDRVLGAQFAAVADSRGKRLGTIIMLRDITQDELSERLKDSFVTHISHELKTPMTVIKMASDVLSEQPEDQPANRRILQMLTRNIDILDRMVIELLDISELNTGSFEIRQELLNAEDVVWHTLNGIAPEIDTNKADVTVMARDTERLYLTGDAQRLNWALGHMIRNAFHYTEPGGHVLIGLGIETLSQGDFVFISVADTGVGITDKDLPRIFERFYRGEARTPQGKRIDPRGLGQGLFVANTVALSHGGQLTVETKLGEGSIFTMYLPATEPADQLTA